MNVMEIMDINKSYVVSTHKYSLYLKRKKKLNLLNYKMAIDMSLLTYIYLYVYIFLYVIEMH